MIWIDFKELKMKSMKEMNSEFFYIKSSVFYLQMDLYG